MSKSITLEFEVGQKVMVKEVQRPGRVDMVQVDCIGIQYRVAYWDNSDRKTVWLYAEELEER